MIRQLLAGIALIALCGCGGTGPMPELVYGKRGTHAGEFIRPRAAAIDANDHLYIVDFTARVQVFDRDGHYLDRGWTTPDSTNGRPSGLSIDRDGNLLLSDSHYHCLRIYSPEGVELKKIGGEDGTELGQFGYISDAVQDGDGYYYVAEAVRNQRITKLDPQGKPLFSWGSQGTEPGQFGRIRALAFGADGYLYVADACNDRIQVFNPRDGSLVRCWGVSGTEPGQLKYPYDLAFGPGGELYIVEYGNHRVQKFTAAGVSLGCWGGPGREPGRLLSPWALVVDSQGKVHVIDSENHRVQRIAF
jgi:DNA-binding beta-propeller fold protein YncE